MPQKNYQENSEQTAYTIILLSIALVVIIIGLYQYFRYEINTVISWVIQAQLWPFSFSFELPKRGLIWFSHADMGKQTFHTMLVLLHLAGKYSRFIFLFLFIYWISKIYMTDVIHKYMFSVTMKNLIRENLKWLPCLAPIVNEDILSEDIDKGPWRSARQALQFCVENKLLYLTKAQKKSAPVDETWVKGKVGLVLNKNGLPREDSPCLPDMKGYIAPSMRLNFDEKKALDTFTKQLGNKITCDWNELPNHVIGLAASFMAFASGDKDVAKELLDHMSLNFKKEITKDGQIEYSVNIGNAYDVFKTYFGRDEVTKSFDLHGLYIPTLLMSLLMQAKQKGVLESSQYIWLRPYDRTLWYSLNQMGGLACWAEAAGPWAHYQFVDALGERCSEPQCLEAVNALRSVLQGEGWLPQPDQTPLAMSPAPAQSSAPKGPRGWAK